MLRTFSNQYPASDDVSVPCRVRRSGDDSTGDSHGDRHEQLCQQDNPEEITCTMRKWHMARKKSAIMPSQPRKSSEGGKINDAELIFTPLHKQRCSSGEFQDATSISNSSIPLSKRFASFGGQKPIPLSRRFASFGGPVDFNSNNDPSEQAEGFQPQFEEEVTIPVEDIHTVRTCSESDKKSKKNKRRKKVINEALLRTIEIETSSFGSYELLMESTNEQLVLMTFLRVNSTKGKIAFVNKAIDDGHVKGVGNSDRNTDKTKDSIRTYEFHTPETITKNKLDGDVTQQYPSAMMATIEPNQSNLTHSTTQTDGAKSIDVETFTAKGMSERLKRESLTEKVERRMHRLVSSLAELSVTFTKCACGCFGDSTINDQISLDEKEGLSSSPRPRRNTASTESSSADDKNNSTLLEAVNHKAKTRTFEQLKDAAMLKKMGREELLIQAKLPSGLSVESDWDDELSEQYATFPSRAHSPIRVLASDI